MLSVTSDSKTILQVLAAIVLPFIAADRVSRNAPRRSVSDNAAQRAGTARPKLRKSHLKAIGIMLLGTSLAFAQPVAQTNSVTPASLTRTLGTWVQLTGGSLRDARTAGEATSGDDEKHRLTAARAQVIRECHHAFEAQNFTISESGEILVLESARLADGAIRSAVENEFKRQILDQETKRDYCRLGFREIRLRYPAGDQRYPLECQGMGTDADTTVGPPPSLPPQGKSATKPIICGDGFAGRAKGQTDQQVIDCMGPPQQTSWHPGNTSGIREWVYIYPGYEIRITIQDHLVTSYERDDHSTAPLDRAKVHTKTEGCVTITLTYLVGQTGAYASHIKSNCAYEVTVLMDISFYYKETGGLACTLNAERLIEAHGHSDWSGTSTADCKELKSGHYQTPDVARIGIVFVSRT